MTSSNTGKNEKTEESSPGIPQWARVFYNGAISLFPVTLTMLGTIYWYAQRARNEFQVALNAGVIDWLAVLQVPNKLIVFERALSLAAGSYIGALFVACLGYFAVPHLGGDKECADKRKRCWRAVLSLILIPIAVMGIGIAFAQVMLIDSAPSLVFIVTVVLSVIIFWLSQKFLDVPESYVRKEPGLVLHVQFGMVLISVVLLGCFAGQAYYLFPLGGKEFFWAWIK